MAHSPERSAGDLIARLVDSLGIHDDKGMVPCVRTWPELAGGDLAAHSQVRDLRHGALVIGVDHPGWLQQLHLDQRRILAAVRRRFPDLGVTSLQFVIVERLDSPWAGGTPRESRDTPRDTPREAADTTDLPLEPEAAAAQDDEFRGHLAGLQRALEELEEQERSQKEGRRAAR